MNIEKYQSKPNTNHLSHDPLSAFRNRLASPQRSAPAPKPEDLHALKERMSEEFVAAYRGSLDPDLVRQAVREANSIASTTPYPALFLPSLAEEKVRLARAWSNRQRIIHEQTMAFAA